LFSRLPPRLTSPHLFACLSSLMPVSSILACAFLSVFFSLLSLASLSRLACLNLVFFFDSLLSHVCVDPHLSQLLHRAHRNCNTSQVNRQITSVAFGAVCYMLFFLSHDFVLFLSFPLLFFSVLCFCK
jgi:hypothetical protein